MYHTFAQSLHKRKAMIHAFPSSYKPSQPTGATEMSWMENPTFTLRNEKRLTRISSPFHTLPQTKNRITCIMPWLHEIAKDEKRWAVLERYARALAARSMNALSVSPGLGGEFLSCSKLPRRVSFLPLNTFTNVFSPSRESSPGEKTPTANYTKLTARSSPGHFPDLNDKITLLKAQLSALVR